MKYDGFVIDVKLCSTKLFIIKCTVTGIRNYERTEEVGIMDQVKEFFMKLIEPLTQVEFYQSLLFNILIIVAYIIMGMIVIAIVKKLVTKFFKANAKKKTHYKIKRSETLSRLVQNLISYAV